MKKLYSAIVALCLFSISFAQNGGSLDPSFGNAGKVILSINPGADAARAVALLSNGSFITAGHTYSTITGYDFYCAKFLTDGTIDSTFGTNGIVTTDLQVGSDDRAFTIAVDETTGHFILGGYSDDGTKQWAALVKYQPNGLRDSTFGTNGFVKTDLTSTRDDIYRKIKIHALTGKIIAVGNSEYSTTTATGAVVRYNSDGSLDASFATGGINLLTGFGSYYTMLRDVHVASNGKITAVGNTTQSSGHPSFLYEGFLVRLNSNGTMDNSFGSGGEYVQTYMTYDNAMYIDPSSGYIYTGGSVIAYFGSSSANERITIKRVGPDGTYSNWAYAGQNSYHYTTITGAPCYGNAMAVSADGKFYLAGAAYATQETGSIVQKLNSDGGKDVTFGNPSTGQAIETFGNTITRAYDIVLQPDQKVVIVGHTDDDMFIARYFGETNPQLSVFSLISPNNNASGLICSDVEFDWSDALGATGYDVEIDTDQSFSSPDESFSVNTSSAPDYLTNLEVATTYYWRVRAYNSDSVGAWIGPRKFTTSLDNVNLLVPADGATNVSPVNTYFDWTNLTASTEHILQESFEMEISTSPSFSSSQLITGIGFSSSNYTAPVNLSSYTTYYWRVRSNRAINRKGPWSNTSEFTTGSPEAISENELLKQIYIAPNPATDELTINAGQFNIQKVLIYNTHGQLVKSIEQPQYNRIDISKYDKGIYLAEIITEIGSARIRWVKL